MKYDLSSKLDKMRAQTRFDQLLKLGKRIELKAYQPPRSIKQNRYLHACIGLIAQETGYTLEEAKTVLKRKHGLYYERNGEHFLKSTRELSIKEMTDFIDWMRHMASETLGIYVPTSEEYFTDPFALDKELETV